MKRANNEAAAVNDLADGVDEAGVNANVGQASSIGEIRRCTCASSAPTISVGRPCHRRADTTRIGTIHIMA
jgi:hypothetical protein